MLTLSGEYIALLVFADICALLCTMCVLWLALRVSSFLSLRSEAERLGYREGRKQDRRDGQGRERYVEEDPWDEEQFGYQVKPLPSERGRTRQALAEDEPPQMYSVEEVDQIVERAMDKQRRQDAVDFQRNAGRQRTHR